MHHFGRHGAFWKLGRETQRRHGMFSSKGSGLVLSSVVANRVDILVLGCGRPGAYWKPRKVTIQQLDVVLTGR